MNKSYDYCEYCDSCDYCEYCEYCDSCEYCEYCKYCFGCTNLVNGYMCIKLKLAIKDENKYWLFNKEVTKEEFDNRYELGFTEDKVCDKVCDKCGHKL